MFPVTCLLQFSLYREDSFSPPPHPLINNDASPRIQYHIIGESNKSKHNIALNELLNLWYAFQPVRIKRHSEFNLLGYSTRLKTNFQHTILNWLRKHESICKDGSLIKFP